MKSFTIAVENSTWNNVGDAFYQMSIQCMLETALPGASIVSFDGPPSRAFRPGRFARNCLDIRGWYEADHYVLSGPILSSDFEKVYGPLIKSWHRRGVSYSLLSVHAYADGAALTLLRDFLGRYPPVALHTRDRYTFDKMAGISGCEYDGICFAFFVRWLAGLPVVNPVRPYICSSFHSMPEPEISFQKPDAKTFTDAEISVKGVVKQPKIWRMRRHFDHLRNSTSELGSWMVVRPVHGLYPFSHLLFSRPNSYSSYNPKHLLSVYKYCSGVVTDRVHAAVAALSFNKPAWVASLDNRFNLFSGVVECSRSGTFTVAPEQLEERRAEHLQWLRTDFAQAIGFRSKVFN